jgi:hypothetical protein
VLDARNAAIDWLEENLADDLFGFPVRDVDALIEQVICGHDSVSAKKAPKVGKALMRLLKNGKKVEDSLDKTFGKSRWSGSYDPWVR